MTASNRDFSGEFQAFISGPEGVAATRSVGEGDEERLVIPDNFALTLATFTRQGHDLLLEDANGLHILIQEYFALPDPPDLASPGGAVLPADLVRALAGPLAPGQYAQVAPDMQAAPIGKVVTLEGSVTVTRADGTLAVLNLDTPVYQGDVLVTDSGSAIGLVFNDDSTFALGENARMVLDELIYDPDSGEGSSLAVLRRRGNIRLGKWRDCGKQPRRHVGANTRGDDRHPWHEMRRSGRCRRSKQHHCIVTRRGRDVGIDHRVHRCGQPRRHRGQPTRRHIVDQSAAAAGRPH